MSAEVEAWTDEARAAVDAVEAKFGVELVSIDHHSRWVDRAERAEAECARLRETLETARAEERERCARWHDDKAEAISLGVPTKQVFDGARHRQCAAAIRALRPLGPELSALAAQPAGVTVAEIIEVLRSASNALLDAGFDLTSDEIDLLLKRLLEPKP